MAIALIATPSNPTTAALAANTRLRRGVTINVVRIIFELYSEVTEVTPSTIANTIPNSQPLIVVSAGSNASWTPVLQLSNVRPVTSAITAEKPIERPMPSDTMIQVDRIERSLVHSE